ncbi:MAG TPA: cation:proton antiporter [candidate division WOR-3 bacterium]|uniref:Cation:proton antiporter n=1 Tax=candidate division WOR-3 bacterium TaxID=2052148 RepID=A0A9C9JZC1_UNCW3|nr:cation:proton antiporter [candidate division WOR-3 bacterium]
MISVIFSILAIGGFLCLFRIYQGPSIADRMVGVDIMGILFVGITALSALFYGLDFLMDLSITLTLFSFIGTLALAKYLEKRRLDD